MQAPILPNTLNPEDQSKLFESIFWALPDALVFVDNERMIQMVNPAFTQLFFYKNKEVVGQSMMLLYADNVAYHEQGQKLATLNSNESLALEEITFLRSDKRELICETMATTVCTAQGKRLGYIRLIRSISERKAAEAQTIAFAQERNRTAILAKFLTDASHDFRHPLSRITTNLYFLERKIAGQTTEGLEPHFTAIREQIKKVDTLLDDLLLMIRLDSGLGLDLHPAYLNPLLEAIHAEWKPKAFQKGVELSIDLNDNPTVRIDASLFRIAVGHLLENAIRYTSEGGTVNLVSICDSQRVYIHVQDSGIGINDYDQRHIFERFYTVDESRNDKTSGSGLGLSIAKSIVEQSRGTLGVASEIGEGSIFHLTLPLLES